MMCYYLPWTLQPELTLGHLTWAWLAVYILWLVEVKTDTYGQITSYLCEAYFADFFLEHSYYWLLGMSVCNSEQGNWLTVVKVLRRAIRELYLLVHRALPAPSCWLAKFSIQQITGQTLPTHSHCVTCFENVSYSTWPVTTATCYFAT
jgi:hypothetical protein